MLIRSTLCKWFLVLLSFSISLLTFCLVVSSIVEKGMLRSQTIIADLSVSIFSSISIYYFETLLSDTFTFRIYVLLVN